MRKVVAAAAMMTAGAAIVAAAFVWQLVNYSSIVVSGRSMEPTISKGATLVVREVPGDDAHRGDIVMFSAAAWGDPGAMLVERVIGIGGDTVVCCDPERRLTVNGKAIAEEYLRPVEQPEYAYQDYTVNVPSGHVWVLGDWRDNSRDSRTETDNPAQGMIPTTHIRGVAVSSAGEDLATSAFTDAGLAGGTFEDRLRTVLYIAIASGGVVGFAGLVWLLFGVRRRAKQEV